MHDDSTLTPERRQQVERIFQSARVQEPAARAAFLAEACAGDAALRREVESRLAAAGLDGRALESPAADRPKEFALSLAKGPCRECWT